MTVSGGSRSNGGMISHSRISGIGSTTPFGLTARTCITCGPTSRFSIVSGDWHGVKSASSSEHSKSKTGWPRWSSPKNSNTATVPSVSSSGPISISVSGAIKSTYVQVRVAGVESTLPISSIARICSVCLPYAPSSTWTRYGTPGTSGVVRMEEQEPSSTPSSRHSNSRLMSSVWSSMPVNSTRTSSFAVMEGGPLTNRVSGGVVSSGSATSHS
jgi:hypothetical protein